MNRQQFALLKQELDKDPTGQGYAALGQDYPAIADRLNAAPLVPNPAPKGQTPKRYTLMEFLAVLQPAEALAVLQLTALVPYIEGALAGDDRPGMAAILNLLKTTLSAGSQAAIAALLAATEPDPAWAARVSAPSRAEELGLPRVQPSDVQQVLA